MHLRQSDFRSLLLDIRAFYARGFVLSYFLTLTVFNLVLNGGLKWLPTRAAMETHAWQCKEKAPYARSISRRPGVYHEVEVSPYNAPPISEQGSLEPFTMTFPFS